MNAKAVDIMLAIVNSKRKNYESMHLTIQLTQLFTIKI